MGLEFTTQSPEIDEAAFQGRDAGTWCRFSPGRRPAGSPGRWTRRPWSSGRTPWWSGTGKSWESPKGRRRPAPCWPPCPGAPTRFAPGSRSAGGDKVLTQVEETQVTFRPLTDQEIRQYVSTGEPMDKAGAYGIQGLGGLLVAGIQGTTTMWWACRSAAWGGCSWTSAWTVWHWLAADLGDGLRRPGPPGNRRGPAVKRWMQHTWVKIIAVALSLSLIAAAVALVLTGDHRAAAGGGETVSRPFSRFFFLVTDKLRQGRGLSQGGPGPAGGEQGPGAGGGPAPAGRPGGGPGHRGERPAPVPAGAPGDRAGPHLHRRLGGGPGPGQLEGGRSPWTREPTRGFRPASAWWMSTGPWWAG